MKTCPEALELIRSVKAKARVPGSPLDTTWLNPGPRNAPDDWEMAFTGRLGEG